MAVHVRSTDWLNTTGSTGSGCIAIPLGGSANTMRENSTVKSTKGCIGLVIFTLEVHKCKGPHIASDTNLSSCLIIWNPYLLLVRSKVTPLEFHLDVNFQLCTQKCGKSFLGCKMDNVRTCRHTPVTQYIWRLNFTILGGLLIVQQ